MDNFDKIKKFLSERFGVTDTIITQEAELLEDLNLSQIEILDLVTLLSQELHFSLPEELPKIETVEDLITLVEQQSEEL